MEHGFRKFISKVFVNGKFPKILPSENFPLYGMTITVVQIKHLATKFNSISFLITRLITKFKPTMDS